jgi:hypothetical protein
LKRVEIIFPVFGRDDNFDRISSNKWVDDILDELPKIQTVTELKIFAGYTSTFPLLKSQYERICTWAELSRKDLLIIRDGENIVVKNGKFIIDNTDNNINKEMTCKEWVKYDRDKTGAESWDL